MNLWFLFISKMDDPQQTPRTFNGSDLLLTTYPDFFRRVNPENNANILVLIILILFVKFLMIFGLYSIKNKRKTRRDDQLLSTILDESNDIQQHRQHALLEVSNDVQEQRQNI